MAVERTEGPAGEAPLVGLEQALIDEFIRGRGYDPHALAGLPDEERHALLVEASVFASSRLMEVESRAHFVHEITSPDEGYLPR